MPRERTVTMGKVTPQEAYEAAIAKAIKLHGPYTVVDGELVNVDLKYAVVYTAPFGEDRQVVAQRNRRSNATNLRDHLNRAWAVGFHAASQKGKPV